jgi:hypothetical protein
VQDEVLEAGLFGDLPARRIGGLLASFHVSLGETPVAVPVVDQEKARAPGFPAKDHAAGARFPPGANAAHARRAIC